MTTISEPLATAHPSPVIVEHRGAVDWVTLNRPERLNAITPIMASELLQYFQGLEDDLSVRVVVLRGAGRGYCAGMDIKARVAGEEADQRQGLLPEVIRSMRQCPQPIVSLVHGPACGGGFAFALASDIRIAGETVRMNDAFVKLGISGCELGLSWFLPRYVGLSVAAELMYTGQFIDAQRAAALGLVSRVVPDEELEAAGTEIVEEMLRVAPMALRKTKETLARAQSAVDLDEVLELEIATQTECAAGPDFGEALRAFVEKRAPSFTDGS